MSGRTEKRSARAPPAAPATASAASARPTAAAFTSSRRDRGGPRRAAHARDEVAVPVEAVLGHALERRIVDVDDPEALREALGPLEVVQQAPDEVAADGDSRRDRARDRGGVRL